jgi:hypothetical protein
MAQCSECGAETLLYVSSIPLCDECDDKRSKQERINRLRNRTTKQQGDPATDCKEASNNNCVALALSD